MTFRLLLSDLAARAPTRPPDYLPTLMGMGRVDGEWLELTAEAYRTAREKFGSANEGPAHGCAGCGN